MDLASDLSLLDEDGSTTIKREPTDLQKRWLSMKQSQMSKHHNLLASATPKDPQLGATDDISNQQNLFHFGKPKIIGDPHGTLQFGNLSFQSTEFPIEMSSKRTFDGGTSFEQNKIYHDDRVTKSFPEHSKERYNKLPKIQTARTMLHSPKRDEYGSLKNGQPMYYSDDSDDSNDSVYLEMIRPNSRNARLLQDSNKSPIRSNTMKRQWSFKSQPSENNIDSSKSQNRTKIVNNSINVVKDGNDLDFYQALLSPSTTMKGKDEERREASDAIKHLNRDPTSIIEMLKMQRRTVPSLFPEKADTNSTGFGSWKETWTPEWKKKMIQRNADVELYDSTKYSELDFLHQFDEILKLVLCNKINLNSKEEKIEFETHIMQMKRFIDESLRQGRVHNLLLKGKLKRREVLIEEQRKKYFHELFLLREELFRTKKDSNYVPTDYSLVNWIENPLDHLNEEEKQIAKEKLKESQEVARTHKHAMENDKIYEELKKQTENVTQTLERLKQLEQKRKVDIEEAQRKQRETDEMRKQLEEKSEEIRHLQLQLDSARRRRSREHVGRRSISSIGSNEQPSLRRASSLGHIFYKTEKMLEKADTSLTKKMTEASTHLSLTIDPNSKDQFRKVEFVSDLSVDVLENEITHFQDTFKDVYHQMNTIKERMEFYNSEAKDERVTTCEPPSGFVAIVFTDVENSTELWEISTTEMRKAIQLHNQVIRGILSKIEGAYEVKTEGDAFMCAFSTIPGAVTFALSIQQELLKADWEDSFMNSSNHPSLQEIKSDTNEYLWRGLRVRVGIHAGEAISEVDPTTGRVDYFGPIVNKAARIEGCARGGEIAISSIVHEKLMEELDSIPIKMHIKYEGAMTLKGIEGTEDVYLIAPIELKDRPFNENKQESQEQEKMLFPTEMINDLLMKQKQLEIERNDIQKKVRYQMRMKNLEHAMQEKDNVIKNLRLQLKDVKGEYEMAEKMNDPNLKKESEKKNLAIQAEIASAMKKFNNIVKEYTNMKDNYDNIVRLFDSRMKGEISRFKKELYKINGIENVTSSDEESNDSMSKFNESGSNGMSASSLPSIFMDKELFKENLRKLSHDSSFKSFTSLMKAALREASQSNLFSELGRDSQTSRKSSLHQNEELWLHGTPTITDSNISFENNLSFESLSPRSESIRQRALKHIDDNAKDFHGGSHQQLNQSDVNNRARKSRLNHRSYRGRNGDRHISATITSRSRRPSTAKMLKNYSFNKNSRVSHSNIITQDMNLPPTHSGNSSRPYTPIVIPHSSVVQKQNSNRNSNTSLVEDKQLEATTHGKRPVVKNGHIVGSYSRMLAGTKVNSSLNHDTSRSQSVPIDPVELLNRKNRGYYNLKSRNVRTLLKIVDRGRAQSTEPKMEGTNDPHRQIIKDASQSLKAYYEKKSGDGLHFDQEYIDRQSKVINPSNVAFGTLFDEIASMRRLISSRLGNVKE